MKDEDKPKRANNTGLSGDNLSLESIGDMMDVTRERVRQIEAKALRKLRHALHRRGIKSMKDIV
jgi:DNA-directed RNA polymerase sigma subunit (sigma70/sigma32)